MSSEHSTFSVDQWYAKGIFNRINDINHPHARLLTDFEVGMLERPTGEIPQTELFREIRLTIHVDTDRHNQYHARLQAEYQHFANSIWSEEELRVVAECLRGKNRGYDEPTVAVHESGLPYMIVSDSLQYFTVRPLVRGLEPLEHVFEIYIGGANGLLSLDTDEMQFDMRVDRWGELIKDVIDCAVEVKNATQTGVLKVGTMPFRAFTDPALEQELGI